MTYAEFQRRYGPPKALTARQIIEARLGRPIGPIATMPRES